MVTLQELYGFIRSLNKAEKRFFKLLLATENSNIEKPLKLFEFLDKVKNPESLDHNIKKEGRSILGAENTNQLYKLILESQRNFYSDSITGFTLIDEVNNLKILFEKAQYKQCRKMLKSTKESALEFEKFGVLMQLVDLEKHLLSQEMLDDAYVSLYNFLDEEHKVYRELENNLSKYFTLYARIRDKIKNGVAGEELFFRTLLDSELLRSPESALGSKSTFLFYNCRAAAWIALHDAQKASSELAIARLKMESEALFITELPRQYLDVLFHSAQVELITNQPFDVPSLSGMEQILASGKMPAVDLNLKLRSYIFLVRLQMNYNGRTISETEMIAGQILDFINDNERKINHEDASQLLFALTNYYIYTLSFTEARHTHAMLRKYTDRNNQTDLKNYSILQEYVIASETGNLAQIQLLKPSLEKLVQSGFFRNDETEVLNILLSLPEDKEQESTIAGFIKHYHISMKPDNFRDKLDLFYLNCINYLISKAGKDLSVSSFFTTKNNQLTETNQ